MNNSNKDKLLIKKFLRNELSSEEAMLFKIRKEDLKFIEALENEILLVQNRSLLKEKLKKIGESARQPKKYSIRKTVYLGIAASILLLISFQLFFNKSISNHDLYNNYYSSFPNVYTQKGVNESKNSDFNIAMQAYDAKDYVNSKTTFETIKNNRALIEIEMFYYGITLLELNEAKIAEQQFSLISNTNNPIYKDAQWYLALSLIKQEQFKEAKIVLESLVTMKEIGNKKRNNINMILEKL